MTESETESKVPKLNSNPNVNMLLVTCFHNYDTIWL